MGTLVSRNHSFSRQGGMAILVITVLLLLVATIGTLMVGRVSLVEQKAAGTDVRSKEIYAAAVGGLEYGVNWFKDHNAELVFSDADGDGNSCKGDTATPGDAMADTVLSDGRSETYTHQITYTLKTCLNYASGYQPIIVEVSSIATAENDNHIQKTVSVDVMMGKTGIFNDGLTSGFNVLDAPPIVVAGCMNELNGSGDINAGDGVGVLSTRWIDRNPEDGQPDTLVSPLIGEDGCLDTTKMGSGREVVNTTGPNTAAALATPASVWSTIFSDDITEADIAQLAQDMPETVYYVTADSLIPLNGNRTYGSLESPVIIYFDSSSDCPRINGNITIYGLVYNEGKDSDGNPCDESNGWGSAEIFGTYVMDGNIERYNGNGNITKTALDFGGGEGGTGGTTIDDGPSIKRYAEIPGTWKDF